MPLFEDSTSCFRRIISGGVVEQCSGRGATIQLQIAEKSVSWIVLYSKLSHSNKNSVQPNKNCCFVVATSSNSSNIHTQTRICWQIMAYRYDKSLPRSLGESDAIYSHIGIDWPSLFILLIWLLKKLLLANKKVSPTFKNYLLNSKTTSEIKKISPKF